MAITLDSTVGGATANSFVSEAEVLAYAATRLNITGFTGALTDTENAAVCEATREISTKSYVGRRATAEQVLSWPRWDAPNPDSPVGFLYDTNIIPDRIKNATIELAFEFIKAGTTDIASLDPKIGIVREKVDVIETEYAAPTFRKKGLRRFPSVWRYVSPLLGGSSSQRTLLRA